jgi:hypothetical protein
MPCQVKCFSVVLVSRLLTNYLPHTRSLAGLILLGCLSNPSRAANHGNAANEFLFPRAANSDKNAAGTFLNSIVKEGMSRIEPLVPSSKIQGKCIRRGAVLQLVSCPALKDDLLPGWL